MATLDEQETTVVVGRTDPWVRVWTNVASVARRLEKDTRVVKDSSNPDGVGGSYRIPSDQYSPVSGLKRRVKMSDEQKRAAADRLRKMREAQ